LAFGVLVFDFGYLVFCLIFFHHYYNSLGDDASPARLLLSCTSSKASLARGVWSSVGWRSGVWSFGFWCLVSGIWCLAFLSVAFWFSCVLLQVSGVLTGLGMTFNLDLM
jgi:hypothetical protein